MPTPGTKRIKYLQENVAASLSRDESQAPAFDKYLTSYRITGPRDSPAGMAMVDR